MMRLTAAQIKTISLQTELVNGQQIINAYNGGEAELVERVEVEQALEYAGVRVKLTTFLHRTLADFIVGDDGRIGRKIL